MNNEPIEQSPLHILDPRISYVLQISKIGLWDYDPRTNQSFWSRETFQIFGLDAHDGPVPADLMASRLHPEDVGTFLDRLNDFKVKTYNLTYRILLPNKDVRIVHSQAVPTAGSENRRIMGVVRDITDEKLAENQLKESKERYELSEQFAQLGHWDIDLASGVIQWSHQISRILGLKSDISMTLQKFFSLVHPEDLTYVKKRFIKARKGVSQEGDYRVIRPSGEIRVIHAKVEPIYVYGKCVRLFGIVQDITERKIIEEELKAYEDKLRQSEKLSIVGQLAAGIAHEVRNPLTTLKGFTQVLQQDFSTDERRTGYLHLMSNELTRIQQILDELLLLAKPQTATLLYVNVDAVLHEVIALMTPQALIQNIAIQTEFASDVPGIQGVPNQLKQIFINIMKNAFEAMNSGGTIEITLSHDDATIRAQFKDTGEGIPPNKLPKLGEPFYTTKEPGTGLGLLITQRIVDSHKGTLEISSGVGEGTTITVSLPVSVREPA